MTATQTQIDNITAQIQALSEQQAPLLTVLAAQHDKQRQILTAVGAATDAVTTARAPLAAALVDEAMGIDGAAERVAQIRADVVSAERDHAYATQAEREVHEIGAVIADLDAKLSAITTQVQPLAAEIEHLRMAQIREELDAAMARFNATLASVESAAVAAFGLEKYLTDLGHPPGIRGLSTLRLWVPQFGSDDALTLQSIAPAVSLEADSLRAKWGFAPRVSQEPTMRFL